MVPRSSLQQLAIHQIEAVGVYREHIHRIVRNLFGDPTVSLDFSKISYTPEQAVRDAGCST